MNSDNINTGEPQAIQQANIETIEKHYDGKYLGDFCLKAEGGGWANKPVAIFYQYQPRPDIAESPYFGIYWKPVDITDPDSDCDLTITDGSSAFSEPIQCVIADNGEIIYSRYRHDYRESSDGSVTIDGGRDYHHGSVVEDDRLCWLTADSEELILFNEIDGCEKFIEEKGY